MNYLKKWRLSLSILALLLLSGYISNAQDVENDNEASEAWKNQDWPNLNKYRQANAELGTPSSGEQRVVFMGNSITEGWGKSDPDFFKKNGYINRGISGQTTPQMLIRFRPDVIDLKPKVVVIMAGTNDIAGNTGLSTLEMIEGNLASMTELAKAHDIQVVLCSVLPAFDFPWRPGLAPAEKIYTLNSWIKVYADKNGLIYLDYNTPMVNEKKGLKSAYTQDGVHPNKAGYNIMEPLVEKAIAKAFKRK